MYKCIQKKLKGIHVYLFFIVFFKKLFALGAIPIIEKPSLYGCIILKRKRWHIVNRWILQYIQYAYYLLKQQDFTFTWLTFYFFLHRISFKCNMYRRYWYMLLKMRCVLSSYIERKTCIFFIYYEVYS